MTLPMLQGFDDATSNLPKLGQNIQNILNPHWQFQQKLQQEMLKNPELIQELSQVERNAPGSLMKLGAGPKLTNILSNTPMSKERQQQQDLREYNTQRAKLDYEITNATKDDTIAAAKLERERLEKGLADIRAKAEADTTVKGLDINKIARDYITGGKVNPADLQTIMKSSSHPLFTDALSFIRQEISLKASEERQLRMFAQQQAMLDARENKKQKDGDRIAGIRSYQSTKVATPEAWTEYYGNPELQLRAQQLADNPTLVKTAGDRQLLAIGNKLKTDNQALSNSRVQSAASEIRKNVMAAQDKRLKPEEVAGIAQLIIPQLDVLRQEGKSDLQPIVDGKNIHFVDNKTGLRIEPSTDLATINTGELPYTRQQIDAAVTEFSKLNAFEKKKWLTTSAKEMPQLVDLVKSRMRQSGSYFAGFTLPGPLTNR